MSFFKKLGIISILCFMFSQGEATKYRFEVPAESENFPPKTVLRVPYLKYSKMTVPEEAENSVLFPRTKIIEITADPIYKEVEVKFKPKTDDSKGHSLLVRAPKEFPEDLNRLIMPFIMHAGGQKSVASFPKTVEQFGTSWSDVTGEVRRMIFALPSSTQRIPIGTEIQKPVWTPLEFFKNLDREFKKASFETFFALLEHNPGLKKVMKTILGKETDLSDITLFNVVQIAHMLEAVHFVNVQNQGGSSFVFKRGTIASVTFEESPSAGHLKTEMGKFLRAIFGASTLTHLFPELKETQFGSATAEATLTTEEKDLQRQVSAAMAALQARAQNEKGAEEARLQEARAKAEREDEERRRKELREQQEREETERHRLKEEKAIAEAQEQKEKAVIKLQAATRRLLAQKELKALKAEKAQRQKAAIKLQTATRGLLARKKLEALKAEKKEAERIKIEKAALSLQTAARGFLARKELEALKASKVQREKATVTLQSATRRLLAQKELKTLKEEKAQREKAAIKLQTATRRLLAQKDFKAQKQAVITLQTATRGLLARKKLETLKAEKQAEAIRQREIIAQAEEASLRQQMAKEEERKRQQRLEEERLKTIEEERVRIGREAEERRLREPQRQQERMSVEQSRPIAEEPRIRTATEESDPRQPATNEGTDIQAASSNTKNTETADNKDIAEAASDLPALPGSQKPKKKLFEKCDIS